jgi:hypothetical protein
MSITLYGLRFPMILLVARMCPVTLSFSFEQPYGNMMQYVSIFEGHCEITPDPETMVPHLFRFPSLRNQQWLDVAMALPRHHGREQCAMNIQAIKKWIGQFDVGYNQHGYIITKKR